MLGDRLPSSNHEFLGAIPSAAFGILDVFMPEELAPSVRCV
jgi:hypothetical protein